MTTKPKQKHKMVIDRINKLDRAIYFFADPSRRGIVEELEEYGEVGIMPTQADYYELIVSGLYDFGEVYGYIRSLEL